MLLYYALFRYASCDKDHTHSLIKQGYRSGGPSNWNSRTPNLFGEFRYESVFLSRGWHQLGPQALQDCDARVTQEGHTFMFVWELLLSGLWLFEKNDTLPVPQGPVSLFCDFKVVWLSEIIQPPWVLALQAEECLPQNRDDQILSLYSYVFIWGWHTCVMMHVWRS